MRYNILIIIIAAMACAASAADHIVSQRRDGPRIVVTWESGNITTNNLFLAMHPNVVADIERRREDAEMVAALRSVITDTRSNITETAGMADIEIAGLYLAQMRKPVPPLIAAAPTNTIEHAIGTGMRHDIDHRPKELRSNP